MSVFIATWNPDVWDKWTGWEYDQDVVATAAGRSIAGTWSIGNRRSGVSPGDRFFVLRQRRDRGIVASAHATSEIWKGRSFRDRRKVGFGVDLEWDRIVQPSDRLPTEVLKKKVPGVFWDRLQASGVLVRSGSDEAIERLWSDHLGQLQPNEIWPPPDEEGGGHLEGGTLTVTVNRYERNQAARVACIAHYGCVCQVCNLDFSKQYGELGTGFIHVHHLKPMAKAGGRRKVDPVRDLRPVCPNCHAMLHQGGKLRSIASLKKQVKRTF